MPVERAQLQRFELKYIVREDTARAVRRYISTYLKPDDFAATLPDYSYPVHTLYLDSPDLLTYQAVQHGEKNRFKLRLRYYDESPNSPVYLEIKKRLNECIVKRRAKVHRAAVQPLLNGEPPRLTHLATADAKHFAALQEFCQLMHKLRATPRSHIAYQREAWMSPTNNSLRVTFDRAVQCQPEFSSALTTHVGDAVTAFGDDVVLELKFIDRLPNWCREMIRIFGLVRSGAPKYVQGVVLLGEHRISNRGVGLKLQPAREAAPASVPGRVAPVPGVRARPAMPLVAVEAA